MKAPLLIVLSLITLSLFADGPPISADGKIIGPYRAFALNEQQKQTLRHARVITLTAAQAKRERIKDPERRLFILTSNFNDCTCGLTYGIWFHPDSVAVFGAEYSAYDTLAEGQYLPGRSLRAVAYMQQPEQVARQLFISASGQIVYQGNIVRSDMDDLYDMFDRLSTTIDSLKKTEPTYVEDSPENEYPSPLTLYMPPLLGNPHREKVLLSFYRLHQVKLNHMELEWFYQ